MQDKRIIFTRPDGGISIIVPAPGASEADVLKAVPAGAAYQIVNADEVPADRTFRDEWCPCAVKKVRMDVEKAKGVCHEKRRAKRDEEFLPLDREVTIPSKAAEAEAKRQTVRDKHAELQAAIDAATTADELKALIEGL